GVLDEEVAGVLLALAELVAVVRVPSARLAHDLVLDAVVDEAALTRDADPVQDVEFGLLERRRHLVLDDLDAGAVTDRVGAVFQGLDATDVEPHRGIELERLTARGGLGASEEDTDLLAQLVDEDHRGLGLVEPTRELAEGLRHETSLQTHVAVAHLAL